MKKFYKILFITGFFFSNCVLLLAQDLTAKEIVKKADEKFNGEKSSIMEMSMTIIRPTWQRTIEFKNWSMGQ